MNVSLRVLQFIPAVNVGFLKLCRRNLVGKKQVNFAKLTVLGSRQAELTLNVAQEVSPCIEETSIGTPAPSQDT